MTAPFPPPRAGRALHLALWAAQLLLFLAFAMSGFIKLTLPIAELSQQAPWTADVSPGLVRFIGAVELAGALGVLLPAATRVRPGLTPLAAAGLATVMLLALGFHAMRGDGPTPMAINAVLGGLALFVAWGRSRRAPIAARG